MCPFQPSSTEQYGDGVSTCVPGGGKGLDLTVLGPEGTSTLPRSVLLNRTPLKRIHIRLDNKTFKGGTPVGSSMSASADRDEALPSPTPLDAIGARGVFIQLALAEQVPQKSKECRNSDAEGEVVEVSSVAGRVGRDT